VVGRRSTLLAGVTGFAIASVLCGAAPSSGLGEVWLIVFRVIQGAFGALLFPSALAIVAAAFEPRERGRALAIFFGITGGLTSIGPLAGGFLIEWTWRALFWINVPVAIVAVLLTLRSRPANERRAVPIDARGAVLVCAGMGLAVLGLQQASTWGWGSPATWLCIVAGLAVLAVFVRVELRVEHPLLDVRIFAHRGFSYDNAALFLLCICFVPLFFFASVYAQAVLHDTAAEAGLYLLIFFLGFATGTQIGGRVLDARGARGPVVAGSAICAVGFWLWAGKLSGADLGSQWPWMVVTGFGMGLVLSPVSTDALNHAPRGSYGEITGITQTVRYFASSLGLAVLGTVFLNQYGGGARVADATHTVYEAMAGVMVACAIVAALGVPSEPVTERT
jgi:EmrB/QacA subfamily drug resistance transporter